MEENKVTDEMEQEIEEQAEDVNEESSQTEEASELEKVKQEKEELNQRLLRLQADYDNFRRRTQKEKEADRKYKAQDLVSELLPALDNFERAFKIELSDETAKGFVDGVRMVYRQLQDALRKEGVEEIPTEGETFDPYQHQAVMQVEDENFESNVIIEELQKGYKLKDRVIRPAMVKVNQ